MSVSPRVPRRCKQTTGAAVAQAANAGLLAEAVLECTCVESKEPVTSRSVCKKDHPEETTRQ